MSKKSMPIEKGHIMMFARAIGDENPIYYDEEYAQDKLGGIIAPPTFIQSAAQFNPDYPLRPKIGEPWFGSGKTPTGIEKKKMNQKIRPAQTCFMRNSILNTINL